MTENERPTIFTALLAVQAEAVRVKKTATNPAFKSKYVTLEALMETVLPILNKHGLIWVTMPEQDKEGKPVLNYKLIFNGDGAPFGAQGGIAQVEGTMPLLIDKQNPQGLGSAITYARRQSLMAVVGIVGEEDDDGNRASERRPPAPKLSKVEGATVDLGDERPMTDKELEILLKAVPKRELGLLLASIGAESAEELSVKQGREMMRRMKVASPGLSTP